MKIKHIRVRREGMELTRPYTIAFKTVTDVENCLVEVEAENGLIGLGSSNPSYQVVGERLDDTMAALSDDLLDCFIGRDIRSVNGLCEELYRLLPRNPAARAALDIAFHDLLGRYLEMPLADLLGRQHQELPTSITIGIKGVDETVEEAQEYADRGFRILKVKLGHSLAEDLDRIEALRKTFGTRLGIRVDANQGYSFDEVIRFYEATETLGIELVEQPMPKEAVADMRRLPGHIRRILAADESLISADDAWELLREPQACGIFNIKLMKCGGIYQAMRIAALARPAGVELMWGCNDESVVSISAALHAAFACPHTRYLDLDGSLDLAKDWATGGFVIEKGMMRTLDTPGLGVERL